MIARRSRIQRRSPLRRSQKRIPTRRRGARAGLARVCAELWSAKVREKNGGRCMFTDRGGSGVPCYGRIDPAHCFGKKAYPAVRYELWNGEPLCRIHHELFGNGTAWRNFLFHTWGPALYAERYTAACATRRPDLAQVRASLEAA